MTRLHELLAAEKTPLAAWNALRADTEKKLKNVEHFFSGHERSLKMIEDSPASAVEEAKARESKALATTVSATLEFALGVWAKHENLQARKNTANRGAIGDIMWRGGKLVNGVPVDELMGLEVRLGQIRELIAAVPTLDATKHWVSASHMGAHIWQLANPEETSKTEKIVVPVIMAPATDKHPAQVQAVAKDVNVGVFSTLRLSGACTAAQKAEALLRIDELITEVRQARVRANQIEVAETPDIAEPLLNLILGSFKEVSPN